jgi:alkanesulfonate monooxygenase SsuD/methylene tetrahydromethanopterin reductase-like flavin-dependent oxidoreductase (luciferase family)
MLLMYFTERTYYHAPEEEIVRNRGFFGLPNRFHDAHKAADLYNMYLDEAVYAEEMGFDAIMLNEHHGTPYCMGSVMDVEAAILARITNRVKIVLLGNPLPVVRNPIRLAEELAEIDMISRGRLVAGWVRGAGSEQLFNNVSPALNRELFNEAHDLVIKCWTEPGPFRFEGKHFHFRFVNPWALPYQKPHPQVWIPGLLSPESVLWAAEHRYPYFGFGGGLDKTAELQEIYADKAAELGYQAGPGTSVICKACWWPKPTRRPWNWAGIFCGPAVGRILRVPNGPCPRVITPKMRRAVWPEHSNVPQC